MQSRQRGGGEIACGSDGRSFLRSRPGRRGEIAPATDLGAFLHTGRLRRGEIAFVTDAAAVEHAIRELATAQRTILTHDQLLACGLGSRAIAYRRTTGRFKAEFPGVHSLGGGVLPPLAMEQAALLACGEGSFLSHLSSAAVWELVPRLPEQPHVTVVGRYLRARRGLQVHLVGAVDGSELRRRDGLAVSSPARVLLELAATAPSDVLEAALDEAFGKRLVTLADVEAVFARHQRSRGSARLRDLTDPETTKGMTRSKAERRFRALVRSGSSSAGGQRSPWSIHR